jgi:hypothetical protein
LQFEQYGTDGKLSKQTGQSKSFIYLLCAFTKF